MSDFKLNSSYQPSGDQPDAIRQLTEGINNNERAQVLLGVTGSGKTFTIANVIAATNKPTLVLSHNKTLTAQLYGEFKEFFPDNAVEYFVSYYDYYQPEAYVSVTDTYIEKDLSINEEVDRLRLKATSAILSGRRDVIVVATVSCIFGMGNPEDYKAGIIRLQKGQILSRNQFLYRLVDSLYSRTESDLNRGQFRVKGDTVDIHLPYIERGLRVHFFGDQVEQLDEFELSSGKKISSMDFAAVFPANLYVAPKDRFKSVLVHIENEMFEQKKYFISEGKYLEAKRIEERTQLDLEMMRELGYCSGIENYSRFFDGRVQGTRPFCLLDYFPDDYLLVIDESHVTIPQIRGMWGGDRARKMNLVQFGFRLPSALDNRPLSFEEFEQQIHQVIFVSATPADYEMGQTEGLVVEQVVRPTGLLDPPIDLRPSMNQIDDLLDEIQQRKEKGERVLVTTLTKRMSEELSKYFQNLNLRCKYIHSEVDTMERVEILRDLRLGEFDVLVGVNLLREGLDLPEVSLVAILDADKEGFLRNARSLTQTAGRAARNANGLVIFYADKMTDSMRKTIEETERRRAKQMAYNVEHGITPTTLSKSREEIMEKSSILDLRGKGSKIYTGPDEPLSMAADPLVDYLSRPQIEKLILEAEKKMKEAAKDLDFITAARYRDEMQALKKKLQGI
ncbi:MAG: excinuclease ABC subunit UvrB [Saprospiraceae bacterium]|nr:excinuclease ABC subunit UvrB [Saprospiraceae bacterium]